VAGVFAAARAEMRYLPTLHSQEEHVMFFSARVLPTSRVTVAEVAGELVAFVANRRAIAFYERAGFIEVLRTDGSANEEHEPDVQMRWVGDR
jgi:hypothetical protein